jgi:RepB DNA-primase from phage plasmid
MRAPSPGSGTVQAGARALGDRVFDRGLILTSQAIRRQLAAMPYELYLIRLIHQPTNRPFPGERLWTANQLLNLATVRFLRARNREGCDVYIHPYAPDHNAGYILVDLDRADPAVVAAMCAQGHEPCVVLQTSPGHLQAWVRVSSTPVPPAIATAIGKHLARTYGGDRASTDWRHLGRLAGFTNQKPQRRTRGGYPPWVKIVYRHFGLARRASELIQSAAASLSESAPPTHCGLCPDRVPCSQPGAASAITATQATAIYQTWMQRWQIAERFAPPDWSIVDLWIARALLAQGVPPDQVQCILRLASPHFPRRHTNPDDYLRRTLARAFPFPSPGPAACVAHDRTSAAARANSACSNSAGGQ